MITWSDNIEITCNKCGGHFPDMASAKSHYCHNYYVAPPSDSHLEERPIDRSFDEFKEKLNRKADRRGRHKSRNP